MAADPSADDFDPALLRALLGHDANTLDDPALVELMEAWLPIHKALLDTQGSDPFAAPMWIGGTTLLDVSINPEADYAASPLPGGVVGIMANGLALSAGTQHPQLAYALAEYLTRQPQFQPMRCFSDSISDAPMQTDPSISRCLCHKVNFQANFVADVGNARRLRDADAKIAVEYHR